MSELPVICLIDMDCFFVQVEQRGKPELIGKPCAVTQYNTYKGGGIIAVNYEARALGVTKTMRGEDAVKKCKEHNQDLTLFHTPQKRGKADSSKYREASFEVFDVLTGYDSDLIVEKASIDEAYIDLSEYLNKNSNLELPTKDEMFDCFVEGVQNYDPNIRDFEVFYDMIVKEPEMYKEEIRLLKAAKIISTLRRAILDKTQFQCSAGISHSKVLAKLAAGLHKPKSQTILPNCGKKQVLAKTKIQKLRSLGGKFGLQIIERLQIEFVDQINNFTIQQLRALFDEKTADYMINLANGFDDDKVVSRKLSKSIGCGKNFSSVGTNCLTTKDQVEHWIGQLVDELLERLNRDRELNNRKPTLLVLSLDLLNVGMLSRSTQFESFEKERLIDTLINKILNQILFKKDTKINTPIRMLSVAATKFIDLVDHKNTIESFFQKMQNKQTNDVAESSTNLLNECNSLTVSSGEQNKKSSQLDNQEISMNNSEKNESSETNVNQVSKTEFQNLNCKKMMDEYFKQLEADIKPKEIIKPKLTILNMFTKIAEKTGQDIKNKKDDQQVKDGESNLDGNQVVQMNDETNSISNQINKLPRSNPIIDLINKNNQKRNNQQIVDVITLDDQQPSTSNADQPIESFASKQLKLIREQGLLDEEELRKLEEEFLKEERPRPVEKVGFFKRKTIELKKKRKLKAVKR